MDAFQRHLDRFPGSRAHQSVAPQTCPPSYAQPTGTYAQGFSASAPGPFPQSSAAFARPNSRGDFGLGPPAAASQRAQHSPSPQWQQGPPSSGPSQFHAGMTQHRQHQPASSYGQYSSPGHYGEDPTGRHQPSSQTLHTPHRDRANYNQFSSLGRTGVPLGHVPESTPYEAPAGLGTTAPERFSAPGGEAESPAHVVHRDADPSRPRRAMSLLSQEAINACVKTAGDIASLEAQADDVVRQLQRGEITADKAKNDLIQIEAKGGKLETDGIDNIYTSELNSGKVQVKSEKKEMLKRMEAFYARMNELITSVKQ